MNTLSYTDARNRLRELIDEVQRTHDQVAITRHGYTVAVLISPDDLAALEETVDVLSSPQAMCQLADSREAIQAGDVLDADQLRALMVERAETRVAESEPTALPPRYRSRFDGVVGTIPDFPEAVDVETSRDSWG